MTVWNFLQTQILGMKWLHDLVGSGLTALGLDISTRLGGSVHFFLYDIVKITILLCTLIFLISYIQSYFPPERSKRILGRFHGLGANTVAALLGAHHKNRDVTVGVILGTGYQLLSEGRKLADDLGVELCGVLLGDGINDSPALSMADVGVTLRDGSDLAREVADVVLMGGSLNELVTALELGRGTMRRIHGNFLATMGLNSVFLAGGLVGLLRPGLSAVLHNLTTLGVSLNAMRPALGGR